MKIKFRYIAAFTLVMASIAVTPACIERAYQIRGYNAVGGEYFAIVAALLTAHVYLDIMKAYDCACKKLKRDRQVLEIGAEKEESRAS